MGTRTLFLVAMLMVAGTLGSVQVSARPGDVAERAAATDIANDTKQASTRPPSRAVPNCTGDRARADELCAQWSAADAAWTIGTIGIVIGGLTLVAAVAAAIFAKLAANHARAANRIAQDIGQAQVRCYLWVREAKLRFDGNGTPMVSMIIMNSGQSPARDVHWSFVTSVRNITDGWQWSHPQTKPMRGRDIAAQTPELFAADIPAGDAIPQGDLSDLLLGPNLAMKLTANVTFVDVFGNSFAESWSFEAMKPGELNEDLELYPSVEQPAD